MGCVMIIGAGVNKVFKCQARLLREITEWSSINTRRALSSIGLDVLEVLEELEFKELFAGNTCTEIIQEIFWVL